MKRGWLLSVEGINFAGKTTQVSMLKSKLEHSKFGVEVTKFPNFGTPIGNLIRDQLHTTMTLTSRATLALFAANRLEFKEFIEGRLKSGSLIVSDRYVDSAIAYGCSLGVSESWIRSLESEMPRPNAVVLLDIEPSLALSRARSDSELDFFERKVSRLRVIRNKYLELARHAGPDTSWRVLDASGSIKTTHAALVQAFENLLSKRVRSV